MTESDYLVNYGKLEPENKAEGDFEEAFKEYFSPRKISPYFKGFLINYGMKCEGQNLALKQYEESLHF
ncbi:MAG: hypothetical protein ACTSR8_02840 [Promethearchaeota archaeon]